jgi:hypothetical protein
MDAHVHNDTERNRYDIDIDIGVQREKVGEREEVGESTSARPYTLAGVCREREGEDSTSARV